MSSEPVYVCKQLFCYACCVLLQLEQVYFVWRMFVSVELVSLLEDMYCNYTIVLMAV